MILDGIAAAEENDDFLLQVLSEKGKEEEETPIRRANDVALRKGGDSAGVFGRVDVDVRRPRTK